jgi:hypothetical protein
MAFPTIVTIILAACGVCVAGIALAFGLRRGRPHDLGAISESWIAQHQASSRDHSN